MCDQIAKWNTGTVEDFTTVNEDGEAIESVKYTLYQAPLGDLIQAYFEHQRKPWWKRWAKWRKEEERLRQVLNNATTVSWHERHEPNHAE